jgi:hypothetical protein
MVADIALQPDGDDVDVAAVGNRSDAARPLDLPGCPAE